MPPLLPTVPTEDELLARCHRAADYSARHDGVALVVLWSGRMVFEDYPNGGGPDRAYDLASGTKSFAGILAVAAASDGLLRLDEPVAGTVREWDGDSRKSHITVRQLLQLVSGIEAAGKAGHTPSYDAALEVPCVAEPGRTFLYSAAPFQIFGELMRRKLVMLGEDPVVYLQARVLDRIGLRVSRWRRGRDGYPNLSSGAGLEAREWAKLGELIRRRGRWNDQEVLPAALLEECFRGSEDHPAYGLTWWLNAQLAVGTRSRLRQVALGLEDLWSEPMIPRDLVYAAGAAKQRLYVSRTLDFVVVRLARGVLEALAKGERGGFSDRVFLSLLLGADPTSLGPPAAAAANA